MFGIQNGLLQIGVSAKGAEVCSMKNVRTNAGYIWQADPTIWRGHSPILFPIVEALKDNTYFHEGKEYEMPKHGFVRHNDNKRIMIWSLVTPQKP